MHKDILGDTRTKQWSSMRGRKVEIRQTVERDGWETFHCNLFCIFRFLNYLHVLPFFFFFFKVILGRVENRKLSKYCKHSRISPQTKNRNLKLATWTVTSQAALPFSPLGKLGLGRGHDGLANLVVQWYKSVHWATETGWGSAPWRQQSAAQRAALAGAAHSPALLPRAPHPRR